MIPVSSHATHTAEKPVGFEKKCEKKPQIDTDERRFSSGFDDLSPSVLICGSIVFLRLSLVDHADIGTGTGLPPTTAQGIQLDSNASDILKIPFAKADPTKINRDRKSVV